MQFKIVAFGLCLLIIGAVAYAFIPAVHTTPVTSVRDVWQGQLTIQGDSLVEQPKNVTIFSGMGNELQVNLTVVGSNAVISPVRFQLLGMNATQTCSPLPQSPSILIPRQDVANQSLAVPLNATGTYCFVFDNQGSQQAKSIGISARVSASRVQVWVARDGSASVAGLGLSAIGLVVASYGFSRKTVIPWE